MAKYESGQARLHGLGAFGSRDVSLVAIFKQIEMLIAHKVSPCERFGLIEDVSKRAELRASSRLAASQIGLLLDAIRRNGIVHVTNIAGLPTNYRRSPVCSVTKGTKSSGNQTTSARRSCASLRNEFPVAGYHGGAG